MNGLNESDVTKVTCVTNVTNEFDETRFLSFLQSDSAAIFAGVSHSRLTFPPAIPPLAKTERESEKEGVSKCTFWLHPRRCVRMAKMQGAEDEGAGSVLKYMTKPESDSNEAGWLL